MFKISNDPQGFKRLSISGRIEAEEMRAGLDAFLDSLEDGKRTPFLYTITDFEFPPMAAIAVEFGYFPQLLTSLSKIGRVAVVADQSWLRTAAEVEGALIPGLEIRAFEPGQEKAAEAWLLTDDSVPV
ncbi:MAG: STAS/SEC14 domain-containing protein [Silicimonas sp.]|nr:STAS/SEC14 domain-containing protein [Silicimonas sp.]